LSFWQPWDKEVPVSHQTLKGFANGANPFRVPSAITHLIPGLPKLNPGLELANTFGVKILQRKQEVVGLLRRDGAEVETGSTLRENKLANLK